MLPRKDLEALGITYRRIPLLSVGKDVYADSSLIIDVILEKLATKMVPTSVAVGTLQDYDQHEASGPSLSTEHADAGARIAPGNHWATNPSSLF